MSNRPRMMRIAAAAAIAVCAGPCVVKGELPRPRPATGPTATIGSGQKLRSQMVDIALDDDRTLRGRFVDSAGVPVDGAVVTLMHTDHVVARSTTLADGTFKIGRVPAGTYRLACGAAAGQIRCWTSETAPPNAAIDGVTFQDSAIRGQAIAIAPALLGSSALTTAAASGSVIGGVAVYAAADGGSRRNSIEPVGSTETPPVTNVTPAGKIVGRDEQGNLVRIRGRGPWHDRRSLPQPGTSDLAMPSDWPAALDEPQFRPASP